MPESKLQNFLLEQSRKGRYHSEGRFSLDFPQALQRLSADSWLTDHHYLLKFVQLANHQGADSLEIEVARTHTTVFLSLDPQSATSLGPHAVYRLLSEESELYGEESRHLLAGLLGSMRSRHSGFRWELWDTDHSSRLSVGQNREVGLSTSNVSNSQKRGFSFTAEHERLWNPLKVQRRISESESVLTDSCLHSSVSIVFNGHELCPPAASELNAHLTDFGGSRFNPSSGVFEPTPLPVAASSILFELATEQRSALAVLRPPLDEYRTVRGNLNVWARALSPNNTLRPNGRGVPAWMLQYRQAGRNLSAQERPERELCKSVLTMNLHAAGNLEPMRLFVVRHGVLISHAEPLSSDFEVDAYRGCTLLTADDHLNTDISGLSLRRDEALKEYLHRCLELLQAGEEYFEECAKYVHFV